jgi:hypothetical protein
VALPIPVKLDRPIKLPSLWLRLIVIPRSPAFLKGVETEFGWFVRADKFDRTVWLDIGFSTGAPIAGIYQ